MKMTPRRFPVLGTQLGPLTTFQLLIAAWLDHAPDLVRVALGGIMVMLVDSKEQGYEKIDRFLPFPVDAEGMSDLLYRINRPRMASGLRLKPNI